MLSHFQRVTQISHLSCIEGKRLDSESAWLLLGAQIRWRYSLMQSLVLSFGLFKCGRWKCHTMRLLTALSLLPLIMICQSSKHLTNVNHWNTLCVYRLKASQLSSLCVRACVLCGCSLSKQLQLKYLFLCCLQHWCCCNVCDIMWTKSKLQLHLLPYTM